MPLFTNIKINIIQKDIYTNMNIIFKHHIVITIMDFSIICYNTFLIYIDTILYTNCRLDIMYILLMNTYWIVYRLYSIE